MRASIHARSVKLPVARPSTLSPPAPFPAQISQALAHLHTPSTNTTSAAAASSAATTARLDSPDFWSSLPGPAQGQQVPQELGGPGDPLLLAGSVAVGQEPGTVQVRLVATNRYVCLHHCGAHKSCPCAQLWPGGSCHAARGRSAQPSRVPAELWAPCAEMGTPQHPFFAGHVVSCVGPLCWWRPRALRRWTSEGCPGPFPACPLVTGPPTPSPCGCWGEWAGAVRSGLHGCDRQEQQR